MDSAPASPVDPRDPPHRRVPSRPEGLQRRRGRRVPREGGGRGGGACTSSSARRTSGCARRRSGSPSSRRERRRGRRPPPSRPAAAPPSRRDGDDTLQRTLLLAQRFVDQTKRESEAEAAEVVVPGRGAGPCHVGPGRGARPASWSTDAEQRLREEVTRLEGMRGQLATDVENMARHLESERNRLRACSAEVLKWVDENVQPAESLMALRPRGAVDSGRPAAGSRPATGDGGSADGRRPPTAASPRPTTTAPGRPTAVDPPRPRRRPAW